MLSLRFKYSRAASVHRACRVALRVRSNVVCAAPQSAHVVRALVGRWVSAQARCDVRACMALSQGRLSEKMMLRPPGQRQGATSPGRYAAHPVQEGGG
jgi:hypothetical protein